MARIQNMSPLHYPPPPPTPYLLGGGGGMLLSLGKYERHISQGKPAFYSPRSSVKKLLFAVLHSCNCKKCKQCLIPAKNYYFPTQYCAIFNVYYVTVPTL
jgi:hypothetical protein